MHNDVYPTWVCPQEGSIISIHNKNELECFLCVFGVILNEEKEEEKGKEERRKQAMEQ
jgi:hypothetical protein